VVENASIAAGRALWGIRDGTMPTTWPWEDAQDMDSVEIDGTVLRSVKAYRE